jgi:O-acetylserine/cysteine efflux transporter
MRAHAFAVGPHQRVALALATAGLVLIGLNTGGDTSVGGLLLILCAAAAWAVGNQVARRMGRVHMLGVVVWSSAFALPPLLLLTLLLEGPGRISAGLAAADWRTWAAVAWQAAGNALFGYAAWGWLLARHPAASIAPLALGVPVFGMGASALLLGEALPAWKLLAAALVIGGLALNVFWRPKGVA